MIVKGQPNVKIMLLVVLPFIQGKCYSFKLHIPQLINMMKESTGITLLEKKFQASPTSKLSNDHYKYPNANYTGTFRHQ
jgi:hypothetical protein